VDLGLVLVTRHSKDELETNVMSVLRLGITFGDLFTWCYGIPRFEWVLGMFLSEKQLCLLAISESKVLLSALTSQR
jgi:hypothetical protein